MVPDGGVVVQRLAPTLPDWVAQLPDTDTHQAPEPHD